MEWIKGHGHNAYEDDGTDDEDDDDARDVEENDVMKLKATESIFIWYIRGRVETAEMGQHYW